MPVANFTKATDKNAQNPILAAQPAERNERPSSPAHSDASGNSRDSRKQEQIEQRQRLQAERADADREAKELEERVAGTMEKLQPGFINDITNAVTAATRPMVVQTVTGELQEVHSRLGSLEDGQAKLSRDMEELKLQAAQAKESMADMSGKFERFLENASSSVRVAPHPSHADGSSPPADFGECNGDTQFSASDTFGFIPNQEFWRRPNPTVLFTNTHESKEVSKEKFVEAFSKLATEANCDPSTYKIFGEELDSKFEIRFGGDVATAARRCAQFRGSLKIGPNKFKDQHAVGPSGEQVKFYVNPDKNGAMVRREILVKQLVEYFKPILSEKLVHSNKATGQLLVNRQPLAQVVILNENEAKLQWKPKKVEAFGVDKSEAEAEFQKIVLAKGEPWV